MKNGLIFLTIIALTPYNDMRCMDDNSSIIVAWQDFTSQEPAQIQKTADYLMWLSQGNLIIGSDIQIYRLRKVYKQSSKQIHTTYILEPNLLYHRVQDQFLEVSANSQRNDAAHMEHLGHRLLGFPKFVGCTPPFNRDLKALHRANRSLPDLANLYKNEFSAPYYVVSGYVKTAVFIGCCFIAYKELRSFSSRLLIALTP
ncbi:MAG TPA: hypothetical protein VHO47_03225 [Candidatus Babeliales bacterium]|nr:hypothetical protein [Candidatus Babeliales bacterium]